MNQNGIANLERVVGDLNNFMKRTRKENILSL